MTANQVVSLLKKSRRIFLAGHARPDGDTLGCCLAMAELCRRLGARAEAYTAEEVPLGLRFALTGGRIRTGRASGVFDLAVILECPVPERIGPAIDLSRQARRSLLIDHHPPALRYTDFVWCDPKAAANAEQVYLLYRAARVPLSRRAAEWLYLGLLTDTGGFRQPNTTSRTLRIASELVSLGVDPSEMARKVYDTKPPEVLRMMGEGLRRLKTAAGGRIATMTLTRRDLGTPPREPPEEFVNYAGMIPGVEAHALLREIRPGEIRCSLRGRGRLDVSAVAARFGGGGHKNAAGCTLKGTLEGARRRLVSALRRALRR